jgi:hypothetical protein
VVELQETRSPSDKPARASTTDAEARVMKRADGGFRPAYNVRMATAGSPLGGPRTIVGIQVTNVGRHGIDRADARRDQVEDGPAAQDVARRRQPRQA